MDATPSPEPVEESVKVESIFVRRRNCLLLTADFSPIYVDYYLHLMQQKMRHEELEDALFKGVLAYFGLHLVSRPWREYHAWTLNLCKPMVANIFVSGSSMSADVIGRIFTKDVRVPEQNMLFAQAIRGQQEPQTSALVIKGDTPESWVESFYRQSEQRLARAFYLGGDRYALIAAQPDADHDWLDDLSPEAVLAILDGKSTEETKLLETRHFSFRCGCTVEKILPTLRAMSGEFDDVLASNGQLGVSCPRCGASHVVTADMLRADDESSGSSLQ